MVAEYLIDSVTLSIIPFSSDWSYATLVKSVENLSANREETLLSSERPSRTPAKLFLLLFRRSFFYFVPLRVRIYQSMGKYLTSNTRLIFCHPPNSIAIFSSDSSHTVSNSAGPRPPTFITHPTTKERFVSHWLYILGPSRNVVPTGRHSRNTCFTSIYTGTNNTFCIFEQGRRITRFTAY